MKIIVVGAGTVGSSIANFLTREGHEVIVLDAVRAKLLAVEEQLDVQTITGNACDPAVLRQVEIEKSDLLLAVTEKDETNLICAYTAKRLNCKRVIARVRSRFFYEMEGVNFRTPLGIDLLISPEILTAYELANFVSVPNALAVASLARGRVELRTVKCATGSPFTGSALKNLQFPAGTLVASIRRDGQVMIARGNTIIQEDDRITLVGLPESVSRLSEQFVGVKHSGKPGDVCIAGAGETGMVLADLLEKRGHRVVLIEWNRDRAQLAGEKLQSARVLVGDATEVNLLREERIGDLDYFIGATGDDENNIMASLLAKELGVRRTACLIDRPDYGRVVEKIGIDVALSPRFVVANRVLAMVKGGRIRSVTLLDEGELEVIEYQALSKSRMTGTPLRDIEIPDSALIGAVVQGDQVFIPRGDSVIKPGSIVIAISTADGAERLDELFSEEKTGK